jgi:hypothetical protein
MVEVSDVFKGAFLTTQTGIKVGEKVKIVDTPRIDNTTFEGRTYLIVPVEYKGEQYNVRLGASNANRIAKDFDEPTIENWVGKEIVVQEIKDYPGLGRQGIIWAGVKPGMIVCKNCGAIISEKALKRTNGHCPSCDTKISD